MRSFFFALTLLGVTAPAVHAQNYSSLYNRSGAPASYAPPWPPVQPQPQPMLQPQVQYVYLQPLPMPMSQQLSYPYRQQPGNFHLL